MIDICESTLEQSTSSNVTIVASSALHFPNMNEQLLAILQDIIRTSLDSGGILQDKQVI